MSNTYYYLQSNSVHIMSSFATSETVQLDINQLSSFTSEPDAVFPDNGIYVQQLPMTFIGKLFRIISATFGTTSNVAAFHNNIENTV